MLWSYKFLILKSSANLNFRNGNNLIKSLEEKPNKSWLKRIPECEDEKVLKHILKDAEMQLWVVFDEENNKEINPVYEEGDFVVYPAHGVGYVIGIEKVEISGSLLELVKVRFDSDRMTLRIPVNKAVSSGLRKLSSKKQMEAALLTLKGKAKVKKVMWSRRAQEYETKINSGNLIWVAEVVRDLHRGENQAEQSYSERQMYQAALERLAGEFAAIEDIDKDSAALKLEGIMTAA